MNRRMVLVVGAVVLLASSGRSRADQIFDFSFTNAFGNVAGTVKGSIDLPFNGDGSGAATHVFIDSYPPALGNIGTTPIDTTTWNLPDKNTFTVTSGAISFADYNDSNSVASPPPDSATLVLTAGFGLLEDDATSNAVDSAGITYTPQATPEPATLTLLGTGLLALGAFRLRRLRRS